MRAGDDHDCHHPLEREREALTKGEPENEGSSAQRQGDESQPQRGAIGEVLGSRACLLSLLDQGDDLVQIGLIAGLANFEDYCTLAIDRPPTASCPLILSTGRDSPVSIASLTLDRPVMMMPSVREQRSCWQDDYVLKPKKSRIAGERASTGSTTENQNRRRKSTNARALPCPG
jgi:hypothetical protein